MNILPKKLSALIGVARKDLAAAGASPDYTVDMQFWHTGNIEGGPCAVCLAGAVIAGTLQADIRYGVDPRDYGRRDYRALQALDHVARGRVGSAFYHLGGSASIDGAAERVDIRYRRLFGDAPGYPHGLADGRKLRGYLAKLDKLQVMLEGEGL